MKEKNDRGLTYKHFIPNFLDEQLCTDHVSMIEELAPSDSYVDVIVDKLADGTYKTVINIKAVCGNFYSEAREFSPLVSLKQAKKAILNTLAEWKQWRF